jgi:hypothetical protein
MTGQKTVGIVYFITVTKYHDRNVELILAEGVQIRGTVLFRVFRWRELTPD